MAVDEASEDSLERAIEEAESVKHNSELDEVIKQARQTLQVNIEAMCIAAARYQINVRKDSVIEGVIQLTILSKLAFFIGTDILQLLWTQTVIQ